MARSCRKRVEFLSAAAVTGVAQRVRPLCRTLAAPLWAVLAKTPHQKSCKKAPLRPVLALVLELPGLIVLLPLVHLLGFQDGTSQECQLTVAERRQVEQRGVFVPRHLHGAELSPLVRH